MKVISKKVKPSVEFGDKVKLLEDSSGGDLSEGSVGVVVALADCDGEVEVRTRHTWDYVAAEDLEVLQKFSGDEVATADKSAVIELTADEISFISALLDNYSYGPLKTEFTKLKAEVA